jgi:hypothetical protein
VRLWTQYNCAAPQHYKNRVHVFSV